MDLPPSQTRRPPSSRSSPPIFPNELMAEVLSLLSVISLIQMKCVSKFFNSLISDPTFMKMHLRRSARNSADRFYHSNDITLDQFVIISLDLGAERHVELMPPRGLEEVPLIEPTICVLTDSLCFCHDFKQTCLIIWQMKEFGVGESWTQL
ncbi:uncharacterized protein LOC131613968 [Vicia villosa]|uniref:uncharacterized protein LOC131613968 n=1 Tax=Vicia villosa TaxID=3911 RepID=UPI00273A7626|nr:uncharacterized protein LOC131613968 [Vicia villosa]